MDDRDSQRPDHIVSFGPFRLFAAERLLRKGDEPVLLGGRSFDVLIALVERAGEVVTRKELISRVWPDLTVEEANLRVQITGLRKALGDGRKDARYVVTVPGRGYSFVAPVRHFSTQPSPPSIQTAVSLPLANLPARLRRMVGRDDTVHLLSTQLMMSRFVSIIGAGGMGKTTVAVAVAHTLLSNFGDAVFFVDLAPISDPQLVPATVALALGFTWQTQDPLANFLAFVSDKKILLVLDNCEHVVDVAAILAERVVNEAPQAHVIATSREALRAEGEHVYLLRALECPPEDAALTATDVLLYPAARLFMERATAGGYGSALRDIDGLIVARICRRLDGIPLAIELAASRTGAHGIGGIEALLQNRFGLLWQGRRTSLPRHQTLNAMLDWSYNLLAAHERVILCRLSVFVGDFVLQSACKVVSDADQDDEDAVIVIDSLVAKSLISTSTINGSIWYRLADTTRSYALKKLEENGERDRLARRHAEYYCDLFQRAEAEFGARPISEWLAEHRPRLDNLRAALNWAFSDAGISQLGVRLAAKTVDFWLSTSLLPECYDWCTRALAQPGVEAGTCDEMLLQCGLGISLIRTKGMKAEAEAALTRAAALSEELPDFGYFNHQLLAIFGLWLFSLRAARLRECLALAGKYEVVAQGFGTSEAIATAHRMLGQSQYFLGEFTNAAVSLQRARAWNPTAVRSDDSVRYDADPKVVDLCYEAVTLWSLGFVDKAIWAREEALKQTRDISHPVSLCIALAWPSSVLLAKVGDLETAEDCINELLDHSDKHSLIPYHAFGLCAKGSLMATRGGRVSAERLLRDGLQRMRSIGYLLYYAFFLAEWAMVLASADQLEQAIAEIDAAQRFAEESQSLWCLPEVLRIKGEILLKRDPRDITSVESQFERARALAHNQEGLSWELRAAISLARLLLNRRRSDEARRTLQPVYDRFVEGFDSTDLKTAKALLDSLK